MAEVVRIAHRFRCMQDVTGIAEFVRIAHSFRCMQAVTGMPSPNQCVHSKTSRHARVASTAQNWPLLGSLERDLNHDVSDSCLSFQYYCAGQQLDGVTCAGKTRHMGDLPLGEDVNIAIEATPPSHTPVLRSARQPELCVLPSCPLLAHHRYCCCPRCFCLHYT